MPPSGEVVYLDSSALVKLVIREAESAPLLQFLGERPVRVSCSLARVEVVRAVHAHGPLAVQRARAVLGRVHLLKLGDPLLDEAADLGPPGLRSLDAIHLAAAASLGRALAKIVTYDDRMRAAAEQLGFHVAAPGQASPTTP